MWDTVKSTYDDTTSARLCKLLSTNYLWMQNVEEAERPSEGFYIRSGITVILKNSTIRDGTVI